MSNLEVKDDILPFISTYNPNNPNVFPKIREIHRNLQSSKTLGEIFTKRKSIHCIRQPSNLKRLNQLSKQQNAKKVAFVVIIL